MKTYAYSAFFAVGLLAAVVVVLVLLFAGGEPSGPVVPLGASVDPDPVETREVPFTPDSAATATLPPRPEPKGPKPGPWGGDAASDPATPEDLPLPDGGAILTLIVQELDGKAVAGVPVSLRAGRALERRVTERDGSVVFAGIAAGIYSYVLEPKDRPALTSARPIELIANESLEIVVPIGRFDRQISGRVLTEAGEPVAGIEVYALPYLFRAAADRAIAWRQDERRVVSDADGRYSLRELEDGEYEVRTSATELYPEVRTVVRAGVDSADLVLQAAREVRIIGVVTDADGTPLADVRVLPVGQAVRSALTDAEGRYELSLSSSGERRVFTFRFLRNGYQEHQETLAQERLEGVDEVRVDASLLAIKGLTELAGVIRGIDGQPIPGETVHLHSELLKSRHQATSDAEGRFVVAEIQAGLDYRVWVRPQGAWQDYTEKGFHVPPAGGFLEIALEPLGMGSVRGYMVDGDGNPVPSFGLWLRSTNAAAKSAEITGDVDGFFAVEDVPAGPLIFETRSLPRFTVSGFALKPDEVADLRLPVDWGEYELRGRIVDPQGAPVAGASVYLSWFHRDGEVRSTATRKTISDDRGEFDFTRLGPGVHRLNVNATGFGALQLNHDVGNGRSEIDVRLEPSSS